MTSKFLRARLGGCVCLLSLSAAACGVGAADEVEDVGSVQQAACIDDVSGTCAAQCDSGFDYEVAACYDQCVFSNCGEAPPATPPPTPEPSPTTPSTTPPAPWPWTVQCEGRIYQGLFHNDYVSVRHTFEGGPPMTWAIATEIATLATSPCEALQRAYFTSRCSTLDRSATVAVSMGRSFGGVGHGPILVSYDWGVPIITTTFNLADVCPVQTPPPDKPCKRRPCP